MNYELVTGNEQYNVAFQGLIAVPAIEINTFSLEHLSMSLDCQLNSQALVDDAHALVDDAQALVDDAHS